MENLPLLFLKEVFKYLNTFDQINALNSIEQNSDYKSYLFNQKELNLSKVYNLKQADFKALSKFYFNLNGIETLNLNFCYSFQWKWIVNQNNFKSLTHLHLIGIYTSFENIILVTKSNQLKEISFSVDLNDKPFIFQNNDKLDNLPGAIYKDLNGFSTISTICIDLISTSSSLTFLLNSFNNVSRLEIFSLKPSNSSFNFSFNGLSNPFTNLSELIISETSNIIFNLAEIDKIKSKLKKYCLPILASDISMCNNLNLKGIKRLRTRIPSGSMTAMSEINNIYLDSQFDENLFESFELTKSSKVPVIFKSIPFKLDHAIHLKTLDLRNVHFHTSKSICKILSKLKFIQHLHIPCCALNCDEFKSLENAVSLKRIFEDDDDNLEKNVKKFKQLEFLISSKIESFGIYSPEPEKTKENYHCRAVDSAEFDLICKFKGLKILMLSKLKYIGDHIKFKKLLEDLSNSTQLTQLSLIGLANFTVFNFQTIAIEQLNNFKYLKKLEIAHPSFCLTDKFFEKIICLENIKILKLTFETPVSNMIKNRSFSPLKELKNLILFDLKCQITKVELPKLIKQIKTYLPNTKFISISKLEDITRRYGYLQEISYFIEISNTLNNIKEDEDILEFLSQ